MSEVTATPAIDKSSWGEGPWQHEPDRADWIRAGFACMAIRHPEHGCWCGYVGVPREHPLYGETDWQQERIRSLKGAHRGVNYAAACSDMICHTPAAGMPDDVWWFGFDCGHSFDLCPGGEARLRQIIAEAPPELQARLRGPEHPLMRDVYRTLAYVAIQTNELADHLRELAKA